MLSSNFINSKTLFLRFYKYKRSQFELFYNLKMTRRLETSFQDPSLYASMAAQLRAAEIRSIIQLEQKQSIIYRQKINTELVRLQQSIRNKGIAMEQSSIRIKSLKAEEFNLKEQIKDTSRAIAGFKEGTLKVGLEIDQERSGIIKQRFVVGDDYDQHLKHKSVLHQSEIQGFNVDRQSVQKGLVGVLNQRLDQKRQARQKLIQLEQDVINLQLNRESLESQIIPKIADRQRRKYDDLFRNIQRKVVEDQTAVGTLKRKSQYLYKELTQASLKGMSSIGRLEQQISQLQAKVKKLHDDMTKTNMEIQTKHIKLELMEAELQENNDAIKFRRQQINGIMAQGNRQLDLVRFQVSEQRKTTNSSGERIYQRILQLQKAVRAQESNNKNIKNQYDKLCNMLVIGCQGAIRSTMTHAATNIMRGNQYSVRYE